MKLPEHVLWTLRKDGRTAEARTHVASIGNARPELRIYASKERTVRIDDLLWSQTLVDGRQVEELAEQKKADFLKHGWVECLEARARAEEREAHIAEIMKRVQHHREKAEHHQEKADRLLARAQRLKGHPVLNRHTKS